MNQPLRALVGARVSVLTGPQKVSHTAQLETATKWAESKGYRIVGSFEDLGVSASVRPDDRPDLGQWLTEEGASRWDVIVWSKMDRAFRSTRHCVDFAQWAEEREKVVVFAEDNLTLNYRPGAAKGIDAMMAELFVYLGSFFAQLELNRFKTRAQDGHRVIRQTTRWAAGTPPLGFRIVDHPSGKGKGLDTDPDGKALLRGMAQRLLDGWSFVRIADWLNDTGALTNLDRARVGQPTHRDKGKWTVGVVIDALTSPKTQGFKMHKSELVLTPEGEPIRLAPPTFDPDTWRQIQDAAALRKINKRTPTETKNPMLGVGYCGKCGTSLAQQYSRRKTKDGVNVHRYYRCGRTPRHCHGVFINADMGDQILEETFLDQWGTEPVTKRVFVAGEDHSHELEQTIQTIEVLRTDRSTPGLLTTAEDREMNAQQIATLVAKRDKLAALPGRAAGWTTETTDQTYAEAWAAHDDAEGRRQMLVDAGIRWELTQGKPPIWHIFVPEDRQPLAEGLMLGPP